jgi:hypothetical protein
MALAVFFKLIRFFYINFCCFSLSRRPLNANFYDEIAAIGGAADRPDYYRPYLRVTVYEYYRLFSIPKLANSEVSAM